MKKIIIAVAIAVCASGALYLTQSKRVEVVNVQVEPKQEVVEKNNVSEAQRQLEEANRLLNEEEAKLLAEKSEIEKKLEDIRKVRMSFSQAPKQVQ